jgi:DNA-3-methyladenine glycosylase I
MTKNPTRCGWSLKSEIEIHYHDEEWGVPVYDDRELYEHLVLDGFQAGVSWVLILRKRENFRHAFDGFVPEIIANYSDDKIDELMMNKGIIRNKGKINAAVTNANAYLEIMDKEGSFSDFIWKFTDGRPLVNRWETMSQIPAKTALSEKMSKELKSRGFKFFGPTICYAFMQAVGMVNDHIISCFRHEEVMIND